MKWMIVTWVALGLPTLADAYAPPATVQSAMALHQAAQGWTNDDLYGAVLYLTPASRRMAAAPQPSTLAAERIIPWQDQDSIRE